MMKLHEEGIERPETLIEFNSDDAKGIVEALRKHRGSLPSSANARASMIPDHGVRIGTRALIRLKSAMEMMKYYETVSHKPASDQLRHNPLIRIFKLEFDVLKDRKKKDVSTPLTSQKLDMVR